MAATGSVNYKFTDWLTFDGLILLHFVPKENIKFTNSIKTYYPNGNIAYEKPAKASLSEKKTNSLNQDFKAMLNFNKTFGDHNVKVLFGFPMILLPGYVSLRCAASASFLYLLYPTGYILNI